MSWVKLATNMFICAVNFGILKWESVGIDSLLEPASSGHSRNCSFYHFCVGLIFSDCNLGQDAHNYWSSLEHQSMSLQSAWCTDKVTKWISVETIWQGHWFLPATLVRTGHSASPDNPRQGKLIASHRLCALRGQNTDPDNKSCRWGTF